MLLFHPFFLNNLSSNQYARCFFFQLIFLLLLFPLPPPPPRYTHLYPPTPTYKRSRGPADGSELNRVCQHAVLRLCEYSYLLYFVFILSTSSPFVSKVSENSPIYNELINSPLFLRQQTFGKFPNIQWNLNEFINSALLSTKKVLKIYRYMYC